jgi:intein/homing endonuclease
MKVLPGILKFMGKRKIRLGSGIMKVAAVFVDYESEHLPPNSRVVEDSYVFSKLMGMKDGKAVDVGCFPTGTKILVRHEEKFGSGRGRNLSKCYRTRLRGIETINIGDFVLSFNENTSKKEYKKVIKTFKRKSSELINLKFSNGNELWCTPEHPIAINKLGKIEYMQAKDLQINSECIQYIYASIHTRIKMLNNVGKTYEEIVGHPMWESTKTKYSKNATESNKYGSFGVKKGNIPWNKNKTSETDNRILSGDKHPFWNTHVSDDMKKRLSEVRILACKDPNSIFNNKDYIMRRSKSIFKSLKIDRMKKTTEKVISYILRNMFPKEYKFNGNGNQGTVINRLIPDFINVNGKKKCIEVLGDYWHTLKRTKSDEEIRIKSAYSKLGYDCLIIWESELKDKDEIRQKIKNFHYNPSVEVVQLISKEYKTIDADVYNLEVEDNNNYFAYGILVHNCVARHNYISPALALSGWDVYGVDIRSEWQFHHPNFHFLQEDIRKSSLPSNDFDLVTCVSTLEHIGLVGYYGNQEEIVNGDLQAIIQIKRMLKRNGILLLTVPYANKYSVRPGVRVYNMTALKKMLDGFTITDKIIYLQDKQGDWDIVDGCDTEGVICLQLKKN